MSKLRVVPLSKQTIPRTVLLVSLVLSRLITRVRSALLPLVKITEIFLLDRFHYDSSLDKGGGQRIQAIRVEKSQFINTRHNNLHV